MKNIALEQGFLIRIIIIIIIVVVVPIDNEGDQIRVNQFESFRGGTWEQV